MQNSMTAEAKKTLRAFNAVTGESLEGFFEIATEADVDRAARKAHEAFEVYRFFSPEKKAAFLDAIADEILQAGDELINRAVAETALTKDRLVGERGRTVNQLKFFATILREGSWVEASIDKGDPNRTPLPKPDLRKMLMPTGPVVVFAASNFPLAFSTAGGDTASALAAGCPVIVKAHSSHLGTNEIVAKAIQRAASKTGMPEGVFASLNGDGQTVGTSLVKHPLIKGVGFTGSFNGGTALWRVAQSRKEPIPVFAEMSSINPVILLPGKLDAHLNTVVDMYAASITLGVGQFCTNPGLILGLEGELLTRFAAALGQKIAKIPAATMLNKNIGESYKERLRHVCAQKGIEVLGVGCENGTCAGVPTVVAVSGEEMIQNPLLQEEVFGPFSMIVKCRSVEELKAVLKKLQGQLTATVMANDEDLKTFREIVLIAAEKAGRILFNGVPTGVEVDYSMQHGGPFPATTDSRFTSVGADAIKRFVRPVCFQNAPDFILPDELKNKNPLNIWRRVSGKLSKDAVA